MNDGLKFCIKIGVNEGEIGRNKEQRQRDEKYNLGLYLGINKVLGD